MNKGKVIQHTGRTDVETLARVALKQINIIVPRKKTLAQPHKKDKEDLLRRSFQNIQTKKAKEKSSYTENKHLFFAGENEVVNYLYQQHIHQYLDDKFVTELLSPSTTPEMDQMLTEEDKRAILAELKNRINLYYDIFVNHFFRGKHPPAEMREEIIHNMALEELAIILDNIDDLADLKQGDLIPDEKITDDAIIHFLLTKNGRIQSEKLAEDLEDEVEISFNGLNM